MNQVKAKNKIIFLVAPPRSLSTAFLRMMGERDDLKVMNEPACCVYNQIHYPHSKGIYSELALTTYSKVRDKILTAAKDSPIFIKEMSFSFEEFIKAEPDLMNDPDIYFILLLRDPHHCIISYYKKIPQDTIDFIISDFGQLTGYPSLYTSFRLLQDNAFHKPYIIHAEQLYNDSPSTIKAFCDHIKIPYKNEHLNWSNLGEGFTGFEEWQENKKLEFTHHWHQEAIFSQSFHQPTCYDRDEKDKPTFAEIKNTAHKKKCFEVYQESKALYDLIK